MRGPNATLAPVALRSLRSAANLRKMLRSVLGAAEDTVQTFQLFFLNGREQNLTAERWQRDGEVVRFLTNEVEPTEFPSSNLLMIAALEEQSEGTEFSHSNPTLTPPA